MDFAPPPKREDFEGQKAYEDVLRVWKKAFEEARKRYSGQANL